MENEYIKLLKLEDSLARFRSVKELDTAINDLLSYNYFSVIGTSGGPYEIVLAISENRLVFNIKTRSLLKKKTVKIMVPLRSFRSIIKDYFLICESYQERLRDGQVEKIEAIDMGRRGTHNEGAERLLKLLENKINTDFETARRLFTIITVLHAS